MPLSTLGPVFKTRPRTGLALSPAYGILSTSTSGHTGLQRGLPLFGPYLSRSDIRSSYISQLMPIYVGTDTDSQMRSESVFFQHGSISAKQSISLSPVCLPRRYGSQTPLLLA